MSRLEFNETGLRRIVVENLGGGSLVVDPAGDGEVRGTLHTHAEDFPFEDALRFDGDQLRITLPQHARWLRDVPVDIAITAPPGIDYAVSTGSADVMLRVDAGSVRVTSGSGDVSVRSAEELVATSGSGDVSVESVRGRGSRIQAGSGDIRIGSAASTVTAKSGSGDISVESLAGSLRGNTGSGDISVDSVSDAVDLRTASGSLAVGIASDLPAWLDLDSVSGDISIDLEATGQPSAGDPYVTVRGRTASGDITVFRA